MALTTPTTLKSGGRGEARTRNSGNHPQDCSALPSRVKALTFEPLLRGRYGATRPPYHPRKEGVGPPRHRSQATARSRPLPRPPPPRLRPRQHSGTPSEAHRADRSGGGTHERHVGTGQRGPRRQPEGVRYYLRVDEAKEVVVRTPEEARPIEELIRRVERLCARWDGCSENAGAKLTGSAAREEMKAPQLRPSYVLEVGRRTGPPVLEPPTEDHP
jgi:hypothetical protein